PLRMARGTRCPMDLSCSTAIIARARTRIRAGSPRRCSRRCWRRPRPACPPAENAAAALPPPAKSGMLWLARRIADEEGRMARLEISPDKVGFVIVKTREIAAKVAAWDDGATTDHDAESILESFSDDATQDEIKEFIRDLNVDEQASLVALAWIGRGSFTPDELEEALATARAEQTTRTDDYLLGMPLLPDYLEEGLDRLGYS